jgi:uncharacterized membrane protein
MDRVLAQGRLIFVVAILALGIETVVCAQQKEAAFAALPDALSLPLIPWLPPEPWLAYLAGLVLAACGVALAVDRGARRAASYVAAFFLVCALLLLVPKAALRPFDLSIRTCVFEALSLGAGGLMLAARPATAGAARALMLAGRVLLGVSALVFGITHFLVLAFIATLIPPWIPGGMFFAVFTGAAFEAAAIAILSSWLGRIGAALLGLMFLLWVLVVHAPRVFSARGIHNPNEWQSMLIALGMCGVSWICAQTFAPAPALVTQQAAVARG